MTDRAVTDIGADEVTRLRAAIGRLARQLNASVADVGFSPSQLSVLGTVGRRGPIGIGELAELEGINPTMLSRVVGKLSDAGLVERIAHPDDGRAVVVQTTVAGRKLHQRVQDQRSKAIAVRLQNMPEGQAAQLLAALPALEALSAR